MNKELDLVTKNQDSIIPLLPVNMNQERFLNIARNLVKNNLSKCEPKSIYDSICSIAMLGLDPDPALGKVYILPYGSKATVIIGYKGFIDLAYQSGFEIIAYGSIRENDIFEECEIGKAPTYKKARKNRGELDGAFVVSKNIASGTITHDVLWLDEILQRKKKSPSANSSSSPWQTNPDEMFVKTVMKYHLQRKPLKTEVKLALSREDEPLPEKEINPLSEYDSFLSEIESKFEVIKNSDFFEPERDRLIEEIESSNVPEEIKTKAKNILGGEIQ